MSTKRSRPDGGGLPASSSSHKVQPPTVYAEARHVTGRTRDRLELVVRCCWCKQLHSHRAHPDFLSGTRTAACGPRYIVVAGLAREAAA